MGRHRQRAARLSVTGRRLLAAVLLLGLVVVAPLTISQAAADTGTYVRLAQLSANLDGAAMTVSSPADPTRVVMIPGVPYGGISDYGRLEPGDYVVAVRPGGPSAPPVVSSTFKAVGGMSYTLAAVGDRSAQQLMVVTDDLAPPPAGQARMRLIDATPTALDVRDADGTPLAVGIAAGEIGEYQTVAAGELHMTAGPPAGPTAELAVQVSPNQVLSVVIVTGGGRVAAQVHVDAAGPAATPPGPVGAGYGGTARSGGALTAALLAGTALTAAALAFVLRRRNRAGGPKGPSRV